MKSPIAMVVAEVNVSDDKSGDGGGELMAVYQRCIKSHLIEKTATENFHHLKCKSNTGSTY